MPKLTDSEAMLKEFQTLLDKGEGDRRSHGFIAKIPLQTGVLLLRDCLNLGKQPGPRIREILEEYYTTWDKGTHLVLPPLVRRIVDQIARETSRTREEVIINMLSHYAKEELNRIREDARQLNALLGPDDNIEV